MVGKRARSHSFFFNLPKATPAGGSSGIVVPTSGGATVDTGARGRGWPENQTKFSPRRFFPLPLEAALTPADDDDRNPRNFAFTTELHTQFEYKGGEMFTFRGDDDVFVYVNDSLVVDVETQP